MSPKPGQTVTVEQQRDKSLEQVPGYLYICRRTHVQGSVLKLPSLNPKGYGSGFSGLGFKVMV